jgi:hypothetical protein
LPYMHSPQKQNNSFLFITFPFTHTSAVSNILPCCHPYQPCYSLSSSLCTAKNNYGKNTHLGEEHWSSCKKYKSILVKSKRAKEISRLVNALGNFQSSICKKKKFCFYLCLWHPPNFGTLCGHSAQSPQRSALHVCEYVTLKFGENNDFQNKSFSD